jgi:hypothetical protein
MLAVAVIAGSQRRAQRSNRAAMTLCSSFDGRDREAAIAACTRLIGAGPAATASSTRPC